MLSESPKTANDQISLGGNVAANVRVLNQLSESNSRIATRVRDIQSMSEREILACGGVLSSIVDKARQLAEESDQTVAASVARSEQTTTRFVQGMREDILAQEAAVQRVLDLASGIENAITAINDLTLSSKVLAINARIEAARLGAQGKGFAVIADSLSGLSNVIRAASDTVSSSIEGVRKGLPPVSARATSMRERTEVFIDEVAEQVKSASMQTDNGRGNGRLDILMELSNQALSHLQFQDPMSQKLLSIIGELDHVKERVEKVLTGGSQGEAPEASEATVNSEPPPGEIMLF
jgi:methyl-accepting chemotaxis protein